MRLFLFCGLTPVIRAVAMEGSSVSGTKRCAGEAEEPGPLKKVKRDVSELIIQVSSKARPGEFSAVSYDSSEVPDDLVSAILIDYIGFKNGLDHEIKVRSDVLEEITSVVGSKEQVDAEIDRLIDGGVITRDFEEKMRLSVEKRSYVQSQLQMAAAERMTIFRSMPLDDLMFLFVLIERELKMRKCINQQFARDIAFPYSLRNGNIDLIKMLIENAEDQKRFFRSVLHDALRSANTHPQAKILLDVGRTMFSEDDFRDVAQVGSVLTSPLFQSLEHDNYSLADYLLQFVDIDAPMMDRKVRTALALANNYVNYGLKWYEELKISGNSVDGCGHSLDRRHAEFLQRRKMRDWLILHGAKKSIMDNEFRPPLDLQRAHVLQNGVWFPSENRLLSVSPDYHLLPSVFARDIDGNNALLAGVLQSDIPFIQSTIQDNFPKLCSLSYALSCAQSNRLDLRGLPFDILAKIMRYLHEEERRVLDHLLSTRNTAGANVMDAAQKTECVSRFFGSRAMSLLMPGISNQ